ncbi:MFS transporter [Nonomuraea sp. NPDC050663]|uniref:MFS transporter n=1 Tax=Nonomuraea sp. NPDC050663 TaxID=3364370 RepID=UPI0037B7E6BD
MLPEPGPVRALSLAVLLRSTGRGLFLTVSVLYFLNVVGLSETQVGLGLTIAGLAGLLGSLPAGRLCDVIGPRAVNVAFCAAGGLLVACYGFVTGFVGFALVAALVSFAEAADGTARATLIGGAVPAERRVEVRAYLRAVTNVGWSLGGLVAMIALAVGTRPAYLVMLYGCAAAYLASAALTLRVPDVQPVAKPKDGPTWVVLRDRPYALLAVLNAILVIHGPLLMVILPMWVKHVGAPNLMVAAIGLINTVMVTFLQVRLSRNTHDLTGSANAQRRAGVLLLLACGLFALAAGQPEWLAITVLAAGAILHVFGEILQAAGSWGLSYELAPAHALGQYQGLYNMSWQAANVAAPALLTAVIIGWGWPGWLLIGLVFVAAGCAVPPATRWAERSRAREAVAVTA